MGETNRRKESMKERKEKNLELVNGCETKKGSPRKNAR
jgi:hypothetical protein